MTRILTAVFLMVGVIAGCNRDRVVYDEVLKVPPTGWTYADTLSFDFDMDDPEPVYRLLVYFVYEKDYRWENLYTRIITRFPNDSTVTDVVSFELASPSGRWYGDCRAKTCELTIPLQDKVVFPMDGRYTISFEQYMRVDTVQGIRSVGLRLVRPGS